MNKSEFIKALADTLSYPMDKCIIINDILEDNFFISKNSKDKIIKEFIEKLDTDEEGAANIYDVAIKIVKDEVQDKLKHPFRSKD